MIRFLMRLVGWFLVIVGFIVFNSILMHYLTVSSRKGSLIGFLTPAAVVGLLVLAGAGLINSARKK